MNDKAKTDKTDDARDPTSTQDRPDLSTGHQEKGDARRPSDTLDRDVKKRGPAGQPVPQDSDQA